ncbi:MAG TPA: acetylornithine deacetylase [Acetobacteraceae bacterium]|nr:acetylornithine deacetylase [Acetobacteraceae bacterium]
MSAAGAATEILGRLVSFDTTSHRSNRALIGYAEEYLRAHGVESRLTFGEEGRKANLHAIIGPRVAGGIALSGHTDCVPVENQAWAADPFALRRKDGRLIGRGTTDMKGFLACCLAMVPEFVAEGLKRPVHLCFSFDEETTFAGAPVMIGALAESGPLPAACIVGEPTSMAPVIGHKGSRTWFASVRGVTGHSSRTDLTANALEAAAEAVAWLKAQARWYRDHGRRAPGFDVPYSTVHCGVFRAGQVMNTVPDHAEFWFEMRGVPGDDPAALLDRLRAHVAERIEPEMRAVHPACGFTFTARMTCPALDTPESHPLVTLVKRLSGHNGASRVAYGTEAGLFQDSGIPTVVCGPGHIAQAHQPEEWIAESEIAACLAFLRRLARQLAD